MVRLRAPIWSLLLVATTNAQVISLGTAQSYAAIAAVTITNSGLTVLDGSLAVFPGTSITGFPPGVFTGIENVGGSVAQEAQNDATTAFAEAASLPCTTNLTGQDLGGMVLGPGVYCFGSSAMLTGTLTLDGQGNSNALFVFQVDSTLTTAVASQILVVNGARACDVFFALRNSASLGSGTIFAGNILATTSISLQAAVTVDGGLYALNGAITLINDDVSAQTTCAPIAEATTSTTSTTSSTTTTSTGTTSTETTTSTTSTMSSTSTSSTSTSTTSTSTTSTSATSTSTSTTKMSTSTSTTPTKTTLLSCNGDNCLNAYRNSLTVASSFCSQYIRSTSTSTVTPTVTVSGTRTITPAATKYPKLPAQSTNSVLSSRCNLATNAAGAPSTVLSKRLSSACTCLAITPSTVTTTVVGKATTTTIASS